MKSFYRNFRVVVVMLIVVTLLKGENSLVCGERNRWEEAVWGGIWLVDERGKGGVGIDWKSN